MIKINLVREGRAVRGGGAAPAAAPSGAGGAGGNINNIIAIGLFLAAAIGAGIWWFTKNNELKSKQDLVSSKQAEAQKLEAIIKDVENYQKRKDSLQKRIDLINQLKQNQKGPVRVMDRISQDLPDLVWLDRLTLGPGTVALNGRGLNPNAIANFVDNVKNDPLFDEPEVGSVSMVSVIPLVYSFDMQFHYKYAQAGAATGATGATGATSTAGAAGAAPAGKKP